MLHRSALVVLLLLSGCSTKSGRALEVMDRGFAALAEKHYDEARADFEQALAIDPANPTARYQIGVVYREQGKWREAVDAFADALRHQPDDPTLKRELTLAQAEVRKLDEAARPPAPPPMLPGDRMVAAAREPDAAQPAMPAPIPQRVRLDGKVSGGSATVRGRLDKEIVRRIVMRHVNEVKYCYLKRRLEKPDLAGRVVVQFTIAGQGEVVAAIVQSSTLADSETEQCIAGAVRRWIFPKPEGGGIAIVSYPFVLASAE